MLSEKILLKETLSNALKVYSNRVYQSRLWYQKIAAFFGFKSNAEIRINYVANTLLAQATKSKKVYSDIEDAKTKNNDIFQNYDWNIKLLYHKTAEDFERIEELDGAPFYLSLDSIINDLKKFNTQNPHKTIEQLSSAFEFTRALSYLWTYDSDLLSQLIFEKIQKLPTSNSQEANFIILPGGHKKHAALYIIERQENGKYAFFVVNTGSGLNLYRTPIWVDGEGKTHLPNDVAINNKWLAVSNSFTNLTKENLSQTFLKELFEHRLNDPDMKKTSDLINNTLSQGNNLTHTLTHEVQRHGTCSMRCLLAFIKYKLDFTTSREFNKFMLTSELGKIDNSWILSMAAKIYSPLRKLRKNIETELNKNN